MWNYCKIEISQFNFENVGTTAKLKFHSLTLKMWELSQN
ncbi:hypothetical protein LEP1GSC021_2695 [Leptospira noguchii str. 1993005606]|nr:hypothetical protein LEP1GSC021_2695 [Leptospira noguchii str. 1993005606]